MASMDEVTIFIDMVLAQLVEDLQRDLAKAEEKLAKFTKIPIDDNQRVIGVIVEGEDGNPWQIFASAEIQPPHERPSEVEGQL